MQDATWLLDIVSNVQGGDLGCSGCLLELILISKGTSGFTPITLLIRFSIMLSAYLTSKPQLEFRTFGDIYTLSSLH